LQTLLRKSPRASATPTAVRDDDWLQAQRYARELGKVLDGAGPRRLAIARAAAELDLTTRQIYHLRKRYASDRSVSALLPQKSRPRRKRLAGEVEAIIAVTLREHWLVLEAPPLAPVVAEIRARCSARRPMSLSNAGSRCCSRPNRSPKAAPPTLSTCIDLALRSDTATAAGSIRAAWSNVCWASSMR
jgi:hypothetical protein